MPTPEQFASGGIIPDPCACGTPSIRCECGDTRCPNCDPTCEPDTLTYSAIDHEWRTRMLNRFRADAEARGNTRAHEIFGRMINEET